MTAAHTAPTLTLNNGVEIPALGLGVYLSPPEQTADAVATALASGYRLIDTAAAYGNEAEVGQGIARAGIARDQLFVTTKLAPTDHGYDATLRAFDASLAKLGLDQLDLYLLHWPLPSAFADTIASYQAMQQLLADGRVRAIGVCNFTPAHLDRLATETDVVPALNQVELHPFFTQADIRAANSARGILTQSWSPIGGIYINHPADPDNITTPLQHQVVAELAERHSKTPAQIVLRWHLQHGLSVIPKSVHAERIKQNIDVFDFTLGRDDMIALDALDTGARGGPDPDKFSA
ncbi:aldo/keto reductase [Pseudonocardia sp. RS11V-5]|uniref:aldo/keto reductase n=1 Tax=Pseudonocardia terrae TaxID=2905831 RepID=UPI001E52CCA6|nr:aldo/keto reductase [Pseudonocardia terrae]MCE3556212.1 aldo/keto reductase [Pseudonocardia terrae]